EVGVDNAQLGSVLSNPLVGRPADRPASTRVRVLRKRVLFHTHAPAYFSLRRITRIVETAHPRRARPPFVSLARKRMRRWFRFWAIAFMLRPCAYARKISRTIAASLSSISKRAGAPRSLCFASRGTGTVR